MEAHLSTVTRWELKPDCANRTANFKFYRRANELQCQEAVNSLRAAVHARATDAIEREAKLHFWKGSLDHTTVHLCFPAGFDLGDP